MAESSSTSASVLSITREDKDPFKEWGMNVNGETGEITGQLILGLDLAALTQRKAQTDGMTREQAIRAVTAAVEGMREGDKLAAVMKDGRVVVKVQEGWRAEA